MMNGLFVLSFCFTSFSNFYESDLIQKYHNKMRIGDKRKTEEEEEMSRGKEGKVI